MEAGLLCAEKQGDGGYGTQLGQPYLMLVGKSPQAPTIQEGEAVVDAFCTHCQLWSSVSTSALSQHQYQEGCVIPHPCGAALTWLAHVSTHMHSGLSTLGPLLSG